ncbi:hypothetical protein DFH11DRAFT_1573658 [Phellopilus nigrolimitatus]|nr:hypothetical protein DFH11DRAFT_1573658 [Phellopilus nigrolimitatus]
MSMPSKDQIDEYIASVEDYVVSSFAFVSDVQALNDSVHRLWMHVSRFGPPEMPDIHLPGLGSFPVPSPPPPPPPPAPTSWCGDVAHWAGRNKVLVGTMCVGAVGAGLLAGYSASKYASARANYRRAQRTVGSSASTRRLLVVVLGGDTPLGPALIAGLEREGYIVITSVSNPDAVAETEAGGNGYVRALVFDPLEPSTLQPFLRSLKATLSLRFPLNTPGDPYQHSPSTFPILYSVVSLLTLPSTLGSPMPTPFEHLDLTSTYESYLAQTHIMPLQAVQALLPLFRVDSIRSQDATYAVGGKKSVVLCVPAPDARVGVPYASAQAMSAAATVRGAEVLRRELGQVGDPHMHNVRVVVADVGVIGDSGGTGLSVQALDEEALVGSISQWTPSEQKVYATPYAAFMNAVSQRHAREPTSVDKFVRTMVTTIGRNATRGENRSTIAVGLRLWSFGIRRQIRGNRFSIGAGAATYTFASYLPTFLLDALLNLPALLVSARNKYLPISPHVISPIAPPLPAEQNAALEKTDDLIAEIAETDEPSAPSLSASGAGHVSESSGSVANTVPEVENSWVSVQD